MDHAALFIPFVAVLGAAIGSFLNVVIYRLPRGLSVSRPRWSFCPHCEKRIHPLDNVPILAWFRLRGQCRNCGAPISMIYPAIEIATMLLFVMIWDTLFIARTVPACGLWPTDWPIAVAYLTLFAALLAISGMDLESYSIDIRVAVFAMVVGVVAHTVRGIPSTALQQPVGATPHLLPPALCAIGLAMGLTWVVFAGLACLRARLRRTSASPHMDQPVEDEGMNYSAAEGGSPGTAATESTSAPTHPWLLALFTVLVLSMIVWQYAYPEFRFTRLTTAGGERGAVACFLFLLLLILASMTHRPADTEIVEEIEEGRHEARGLALRESFALFLPLCAGIVVFVLLRRRGLLEVSWPNALSNAAAYGAWTAYAAAGAHAVAGMIFAAALGWMVRVGGTLGFGKEAFGSGDIYIMAAIGATTGFWAVFFGFFLAALLALVGVFALLFKKSSRAIPFGPWLAMGAFAGLWVQGLLLSYFGAAGSLLWSLLGGSLGN